MTLQFVRISPTRLFATIVCVLVALSGFCSITFGSDFSNGLFECLETERASWSSSSGAERDGFFTNLATLDVGSYLGQDDALIDAIGAVRESESSTADYRGNGYSFTQDVVMRGSVSLPSFSALQVWGNAYSGSGHVRPLSWERRITRNNTGVSLGLNLPLGAATLSGFYNYHRDREFFSPGRVQQTDNSYGLSFYFNSGGFYATCAGLYGVDDYKARSRSLGSPEFKGSQSAAYVETGYSMMQGGMFVLEPFAAYHYANVRHDKFNESSWTTSSGKDKYNSCTATLGSRVNLNLAGLDSFTLQGRMAWVAELRSRSEAITTFHYGRVPGTFTPASPYYADNGGGNSFFWGGAGLRLSLMGMLAVAIDYDCLANSRQTLHEGSLGLLFGF